MPRTARAALGGIVYHVLNRGNGRTAVFREPEDYQSFVDLLIEGKQRARVELFGYCLMPGYWHLVLQPKRDQDLAAYLSWVTNTHVKRYRARYRQTRGHLYQGRYESFPVQEDEHFLNLLRYVEANPLRGKLVDRAQDWPWSSLGCDRITAGELLNSWPVERPARWTSLVDKVMEKEQVEQLKVSLDRGRPLGRQAWTLRTAERMGIQYTLNPRGRPRKEV